MSLEQLNTLDAIRQFLDGTWAVAFKVATGKQERYWWVQNTLVKHHYFRLDKANRGTVTRYLMKVTGYSLALELGWGRLTYTLPQETQSHLWKCIALSRQAGVAVTNSISATLEETFL